MHEDNNIHITEEECNKSQALSEKSPTIGITGLKNALVKEGKRQEVILLSESDKRKDGKAQDEVTKDATYQVDDIHNNAIPTLTDQMLKQDPEHHTKAIPVPPSTEGVSIGKTISSKSIQTRPGKHNKRFTLIAKINSSGS